MYQTVDTHQITTIRGGSRDKDIEMNTTKIQLTPIHHTNTRTIHANYPPTHLAVNLTKRMVEASTEESVAKNHLVYIYIITKDVLWRVAVARHRLDNFAITKTMKCISMHLTD